MKYTVDTVKKTITIKYDIDNVEEKKKAETLKMLYGKKEYTIREYPCTEIMKNEIELIEDYLRSKPNKWNISSTSGSTIIGGGPMYNYTYDSTTEYSNDETNKSGNISFENQ